MAALFKKDKLYQQLRADIISGKYPDGALLPSGVEFARQLGVGRVTLDAALANLENEMLVKRVKGRGTYINLPVSSTANRAILMLVGRNYMRMPDNTCLRMFPRFHQRAEEYHFNEIFFSDEELQQMTPAEFRAMIAHANIRGIFVFPHVFSGQEPWLEHLRQSGIPVILAYALRTDHAVTGCAAVTVRMKESMRDALRHLARRGNRNVAVIGIKTIYEERMLDTSPLELHREIEACALKCPLEWMSFCLPERETIRGTVEFLLSGQCRPDVILTEGALLPAVSGVLRESGLKIAEDIDVLAFTDRRTTPPEPGVIVFDCDYDGIAAKTYQLLLESEKWFPDSPPNRYHYYLLEESHQQKESR